MTLEEIVAAATQHGASDIHLEAGLPLGLRVRGTLKMTGEPMDGAALLAMARGLLLDDAWAQFQERRSFDLSRSIRGQRCRINVLHTSRGVGFAIRLLSNAQPTIRRLNLHPDLKKLVQSSHGLILVSGPTGSGKTSTLAAMINEVNATDARHILTVESPMEYAFRPQQSFIRQREVGRDTPSFLQALLDSLREDPDVLMVGEMRDPQTMMLTLNAAETGHLVMATVHSSSCAEALQRVVGAFPPEIQPSICAQLADCLVGVVCQRLKWRDAQKMRVPELEILMGNTPAKAVIRSNQFFKLGSVLESGGGDGMWSFARYRDWLDHKTEWANPDERDATAPAELPPAVHAAPPVPLAPAAPRYPRVTEAHAPAEVRHARPVAPESGAPVFELDEVAEDPLSILKELESRKGK